MGRGKKRKVPCDPIYYYYLKICCQLILLNFNIDEIILIHTPVLRFSYHSYENFHEAEGKIK